MNKISADGLFMHLFSVQDGIFIEVDLTTKAVTRTLYTGGTPVQSNS